MFWNYLDLKVRVVSPETKDTHTLTLSLRPCFKRLLGPLFRFHRDNCFIKAKTSSSWQTMRPLRERITKRSLTSWILRHTWWVCFLFSASVVSQDSTRLMLGGNYRTIGWDIWVCVCICCVSFHSCEASERQEGLCHRHEWSGRGARRWGN